MGEDFDSSCHRIASVVIYMGIYQLKHKDIASGLSTLSIEWDIRALASLRGASQQEPY
jgi:hypothetical protein